MELTKEQRAARGPEYQYRKVRDFFVQTEGGYKTLHGALAVVVPVALAMDTEPELVKVMLDQTKAELERRVKQYESELEWLGEHGTDERIPHMVRFQLRQSKACLELLDKFSAQLARVERWARRASPHFNEVDCNRSDAITEDELDAAQNLSTPDGSLREDSSE